jgi:thioredoxin-related protein
MKKLVVLFLLVVVSKVYSQDSTLNWVTDFKEAKQISAKQDKPILMYFTGSDWCLPCKKLKADFFNTEKFSLKSQDFVLLIVDLPRRSDLITLEQKRKNMLLMQDYNRRNSFPTLVGLDSDGKVLGDINGYSSKEGTDDYYAFLNKILKKY